ncbi:hydrogenase expression/formation protein HypE [Dactylosporangium matsuzakiense]|uniref:Hydrogenase expression/formation protein HypE n=1 Tax=Dactylosporangium matsuzakiense TaxID=53360 RepID=A0A9W6NQ90_9ACTN|nr:hydrogenase expression/formation protein HypE [Dactylosporangium matsuzakiense]GLL05279.1 hydrogenase expression/formation protein HypE [Dactylosporangium matsuzakiense]
MSVADPARMTCPPPRPEPGTVLLGHGSGGQLSADLLHDVILPAFGPAGAVPEDAALLSVDGAHLALSTDAYVVNPLFFPGGDIGTLAVHGTINDLAMMGATPVALALAFVIEEGVPVADLSRICTSAATAAEAAGTRIVTGDTKVVGRGAADGLFVTTTGVGRRLPGAAVSAAAARPGDVVLLSGPIAAHGTAIIGAREALGFDSAIVSDTRALHRLVVAMIATAGPAVHTMRDPTRGGVASALNEIAVASRVGVEIDEVTLPVPGPVAAACDLLGLDPLHVAGEGCLAAIVTADAADGLLAAMRSTVEGQHTVAVGRVVPEHPGRVVLRTVVGGRRIVDPLVGEQLPRIC